MGCLHCHPSHGSNRTSPAYAESKTADGNAGWGASQGNHRVGGNPSKLAGVGLVYANEGNLAGDETFWWACHDAIGVKDFRGDANAEAAGAPASHWQGTWTRPAGGVSAYKNQVFKSSHVAPEARSPPVAADALMKSRLVNFI